MTLLVFATCSANKVKLRVLYFHITLASYLNFCLFRIHYGLLAHTPLVASYVNICHANNVYILIR